jgi:hypothetical protein
MTPPPTVEDVKTILSSPLFHIFVLIERERQRSLTIHGSWSKYTPCAMSAAIRCEVAEVDLAIELDDMADLKKELIHTANCSCKAVLELIRRG